MKKREKKLKKIPEEVKRLVIERLSKMPSDRKVFIGNNSKCNGYTRKELVEFIENDNEVGVVVVEMEMSFLKALGDGSLLETITSE